MSAHSYIDASAGAHRVTVLSQHDVDRLLGDVLGFCSTRSAESLLGRSCEYMKSGAACRAAYLVGAS
jgi:hypothetical protein